jgi:hypothetical protein
MDIIQILHRFLRAKLKIKLRFLVYRVQRTMSGHCWTTVSEQKEEELDAASPGHEKYASLSCSGRAQSLHKILELASSGHEQASD